MSMPREYWDEWPQPRLGNHELILADVRSVGLSDWTPQKEQILFTWFSADVDSNGHPIQIFRKMAKSSHPSSKLVETILHLTGLSYQEAFPEGSEFNLERLIGLRCLARVGMKVLDGKRKYPRSYPIPIVLMPRESNGASIPKDFIRAKDLRYG